MEEGSDARTTGVYHNSSLFTKKYLYREKGIKDTVTTPYRDCSIVVYRRVDTTIIIYNNNDDNNNNHQ